MSVAKARVKLADRQHWRCIYCGFEMARDAEHAARLVLVESPRFDLPPRMIARAIDGVEVSFEHVVARIDGGRNNIANGVAACTFCNWLRGRADMLEHAGHIVALVASRRHPRCLLRDKGLWPVYTHPWHFERLTGAVA